MHNFFRAWIGHPQVTLLFLVFFRNDSGFSSRIVQAFRLHGLCPSTQSGSASPRDDERRRDAGEAPGFTDSFYFSADASLVEAAEKVGCIIAGTRQFGKIVKL